MTRAFLRRLEASGQKDLLEPVREGWEYQLLEGQFSFSEGIISSYDNDSGEQETSKNTFVEVRFVQQIMGDSGGEAPLGSAFFHISCVSTPRFSSIRPRLDQFIDWAIVNKWIDECEHNHSSPCQGSSTSKGLGRPARVIDVHKKCVTHLPPVNEYVTLSYVWGYAALSKGILTATKSNISSLGEIGALSELELPKTIEDAMEVCRRIGRQYLWVDSLCIIQDDPSDVREQIVLMSDIYLGSFLTIIAAGGDHADAGLPGVLNGIARDHQQVATFDGLEMIEILPLLGDVIQHSSWMSRAWTQQEWLLSDRRLYFTNVQVYFQCRTELYNEDAWVMKAANSNSAPEKLNKNTGSLPSEESERSSLPWPRFRDLLEDYTSRHLSYSNDIFNACAGLYHYVYGPQAKELIFGMPENDFYDALRWHSPRYTTRVPESKEFVIPSWSWGSRKADLRWFRGNGWKSGETSEEGPMTVPLVRFAVCLQQDQAWTMIECAGEKERLPAMMRKVAEFPTPIAQHTPHLGRLRFRTQSAMFRLKGEIGYFEMKDRRQFLQLEIEHCKGYAVSRIDVDFNWALKHAEKRCTSRCMRSGHDIYPSNNREAVEKMYEAGWNQCRHYVRDRLFKFVLISATDIPSHWTISTLGRYIEGKDPGVKNEVDSYLGAIEPDNFYQTAGDGKDLHVILVEDNGAKDAAHRVGVTNLRLDDWLKSEPVMEDIVLE